MSRLAAKGLEAGDVARRIARRLRSLLRARSAAVYAVDPHTRALVLVAASGKCGWTPRLPPGSGAIGAAARLRAPLATPDILADRRIRYSREARRDQRSFRHRAQLAVALRIGGRVVGGLAVTAPTGHRFSRDALALAGAFAGHAASALEYSSVLAEAARGREEASRLVDVARDLSQALAPAEAAQRIAEAIIALTGGDSAVVRQLDDDGGLVVVGTAGASAPHFPIGHVLPPGMGLGSRAAATGVAVWTRDQRTDRRLRYDADIRRRLAAAEHRAVLTTPIRVGTRVAGTLAVAFATPRSFTAGEIALAERFAAQAGVALHNAELYAASQRERREAELFAQLLAALNSSRHLDTVLGRVADGAKAMTGADTAGIGLYEGGTGALSLRIIVGSEMPSRLAGLRLERGQGVHGIVRATGRPFRTSNYGEDPRISGEQRSVIASMGVVSVLAVPLRVGEHVVGTIYASNCTSRPFSDAHEARMERLAAHAAVAIRQAQLLRERHGAEVRVEAAQARLSESEERYRALIDGSSLPIYLHQHGVIRVASTALARLLGYDEGRDLLGKPCSSLVAPPVDGGAARGPATQPEEQPLSGVVETQLVRRDGTLVWVEVSAALIPWEGESAVLVTSTDISERKHAEAEAERHRQDGERLRAMTAKLTGTLDLGVLGAIVTADVLELVSGVASSLRVLQPDGSLLSVGWAGEPGHFYVGHVLPAGVGRSARAIAEQRSHWTEDVAEDETVPLPSELRRAAEAAGHRAVIVVPLVAHGRAIGTLAAIDSARRAFTDRERELLEAFANQAALAVSNAQLYAEAVDRRLEAEAVAEVARSINASLELDAILERVTEAARTVNGADCAAIHLRDSGAPRAQERFRLGRRAGDPSSAIEIGRDVIDIVVESGRVLQRNGRTPAPEADWEGGALLAVPIRVGDEIRGAISVANRRPRPLPGRAVTTLARLADHAAVAIANAEAFDRERRAKQEAEDRRRDMEILSEVGSALATALEFERVAEQVVDGVLRLIPVSSATLRFLRPDGSLPAVAWRGDLAPPADNALAPGEGIAGQALEVGAAVWTADLGRDPSVVLGECHRQHISAIGQRATLVVPLVARGRVLGTLGAMDREARSFSEREVQLLEAFAGRAALALDNAQLFAEAVSRRRTAEALIVVARTLSANLEPDAVAHLATGLACSLLDTPTAALYLVDPATGGLELYTYEHAAGQYPWPARLEPGVGGTGWAARERRAFASSNVLADTRITFPEDQRVDMAARASDFATILAIPVSVKSRPVGVLTLRARTGRVFEAAEIDLARALTDHAAVAFENARLYVEATVEQRNVTVLADIGRSIGSSLDIDTILQRVAEAARELTWSDTSDITLRDTAADVMCFRYRSGTPAERYTYAHVRMARGEGIGGAAWLAGRAMRTANRQEDGRFADYTELAAAESLMATLVVPIKIGDVVEGLIYVNRRTPHPYGDRDEVVLSRLADHAAIAIRNAELFTDVRAAGRRLRTLSTRLVEVQEAERRHIARELHDEVGQLLTAAKINLQMLGSAGAGAAVGERIAESTAIVDRILQGVRKVSLDLRPSSLDDLGLVAALRSYAAGQAQRAGLALDIHTDELPRSLPATLTSTCFRIAQEAITNVARHARATRLTLGLARAGDTMVLSIADDGCGFDLAAANRRAAGGASLGLLGMEERALLVGGRLVVQSAPGQGTEVRAVLPMAPGPGDPPGDGGPGAGALAGSEPPDPSPAVDLGPTA